MAASAQGIDVSSYQARLTAAELAGLRFAIARVSDWSGTAMRTDPNFAANWAVMRSAGLYRGAYWYLLPNVNATAQARYFVAAVRAAGLNAGDMLACDSEVAAANADAATKAFCDEVASLAGPHSPVLVYTNENVGQHLTSCTGYPLWFAWPSASAPGAAQIRPWRRWTFWQSGERAVGGLGPVDADQFRGTAADLAGWIAGYLPKPSQSGEGDEMPLLVNGPNAVTPIVVPGQAAHLMFVADEGAQGLPPAQLRVGASAPWKVEDITVSWSTSPVMVALPAHANRVTVERLDQGNVNVAYAFA